MGAVAGSPELEVVRTRLPPVKAAIELEFMSLFASAIGGDGPLLKFTANEEDDLDFTIHLPFGDHKVDLMEMVYSTGQGSPYEQRGWVNSVEYARQVTAKILAKSDKYQSRPAGDKDLLLYTTHWRFNPTTTVLALIEHGLRSSPRTFGGVFYLNRLSQTEALPMMLWPEQHIGADFDPASVADHQSYPMPLDGWQLDTHV